MFTHARVVAGTVVRRLAWCFLFALATCGDPAGPLFVDRALPTPGDTLFSAVVSSDSHSCALTTGGRAFCWGSGRLGQLGTGSIPGPCAGEPATSPAFCVDVPTPVAGGLRFTRLAAGGWSTCGITPSGRLYCWGGIGWSLPGSNAPVPVGGAMRFSDVNVRDFICAIGTDGKTYCWGDNSYGRLGIPIGTSVTLDEARPIEGAPAFATIRSTVWEGCGTTTGSTLHCWGGNVDTTMFEKGDAVLASCQFGKSMLPCTHVPLKMRGAEQWSRRTTDVNSCAITTGGGASCWRSAFSEWGGAPFGRSTSSPATLEAGPRPLPLVLPTPIRDIVGAPAFHGACAHAVDGRVVCWGESAAGQFGTGVVQESFAVPTVVAGGRSFAQLSAGSTFMCGLTNGGDVMCWGDASRGVVGTGTIVPANFMDRRPVTIPTRVASIAGKE